MQKINTSRKILYLLLLGALPLFFVAIHYYSAFSYQESLSLAIEDSIALATIKNKKERTNKQVKQLFAQADHFYIDKQIEKIPLLQEETARLQTLLKQGYHPDEDEIKKRLQFLTSPQNRLSFSEGSIKNYKDFQETIETLSHPVEVNFTDLKRIISRIEGTALLEPVEQETESVDEQSLQLQRPHLIITECKLEKKKAIAQDVFVLDLKVLKREYLK